MNMNMQYLNTLQWIEIVYFTRVNSFIDTILQTLH